MRATVKKILNSLETQDLGFVVFYQDEEGVSHTYTVYTNDQFRQIVKQLFGGRVYDDWEDDSDEGDAAIDFYSSYSVWRTTRQETYGRRMYALSIKFNPLENYNGHEYTKRDFTHGEKIDLSFDDRKDTTTDDSFIEHSFNNYKETEKADETNTRSYGTGNNAYTETSTVGEMTHTDKTSADDATDFVNAAQGIDAQHTDSRKIENSITDTRQTGQNGNTKEIAGSWKDAHGIPQDGSGHVFEKTGKETTEHSGKDTEEITQDRAGNLGITTSQQMLASDMDLLRYDITMMAIREFMQLYTFVSLEVD